MISDSKIHTSVHSFGSNQQCEILNDPTKIRTQKITPLLSTQKTLITRGDWAHKQRRSSSPISLTAPKRRQRLVSPIGKDSIGPSNGTTIEELGRNSYETIAALTQQQNKNLKDQNKFLLEKIKKMQERQKKLKQTLQKARKYKYLYQKAKLELQVAKQQCQTNKQTANQMKKIAEMGIHNLKQKVQQYYQQQQNEPSQENQSFSFQNNSNPYGDKNIQTL